MTAIEIQGVRNNTKSKLLSGTSAPATHTKIQIKNSADVLVVTQSLTMPVIDATSSVSESCEVIIPSTAAAGPYKAFIIVDNDREIPKGTTGNDRSAATAFTVIR